MEWGLAIGRSLHFFFQLALIVLLVRGYMQTRNRGFLWLGAALLIWPEIVELIYAAQLKAATHDATRFNTLGPVEYAIGSTLLLAAVFQLGRPQSIPRPRTP
jgi:hypothetical protein